MWHLEYVSKEQEQNYLKLLIDKVKGRRDAISIPKVKRYLTDSKIKELLLSKPDKLYSKINEYKTKFFVDGEYDKAIKARSSKKRTPEQKKLVDKYKPIFKAFNYDNWIVKNKDISYAIAKIIGQNTCVYCNRQYIFTVDDEKNDHITRPEFDHYLPKSKYPFFALSLYNLIPSCHICNSNCKGNKELTTEMNPYSTKQKDYFKFSYNIDKGGFPSSIEIKDIDISEKIKVEKMLCCFKIREIYNCHVDLELKDLHAFATKYSDTYLQDVLRKISTDLKFTQEEAYRILFGAELLEMKDNDRPLSKFKRDILKELGVI